MIQVSFKKDSEGVLSGFMCEGHADFAQRGRDIVCAAVSTLTINTVNSIEQLTTDKFILDINEKKGYMKFELCDTPSSQALILLQSLELGLKEIYEENKNKYIKFIDWEV